MAYTAWSVVFGEQPTAAKWNQLGANDAGFKDGTNIDNDAIIERHILNGVVTTKKMKPTYHLTAGNSGGSRQTVVGAATATVTGLSKSYTSGASAEILFVFGEALIQITSAGAQFFLAAGGTPIGKSDYLDTTGGFWKKRAFAFYEIAANTTITIDARVKNIGGTATIANSSADQVTSPSYGGELDIIAFGR